MSFDSKSFSIPEVQDNKRNARNADRQTGEWTAAALVIFSTHDFLLLISPPERQ